MRKKILTKLVNCKTQSFLPFCQCCIDLRVRSIVTARKADGEMTIILFHDD